MKLHTLRYSNSLSAILEDFFSIRFKPHQVVLSLQVSSGHQFLTEDLSIRYFKFLGMCKQVLGFLSIKDSLRSRHQSKIHVYR